MYHPVNIDNIFSIMYFHSKKMTTTNQTISRCYKIFSIKFVICILDIEYRVAELEQC